MDDIRDLSIISALDRRAELEPESIWVSIPKDNNDLSKGFRDINYREFANAVEYASTWLGSVLGSGEERIHTVSHHLLRVFHYESCSSFGSSLSHTDGHYR